MTKWILGIVALLLGHLALADQFSGKMTCTKIGSEGSKVILTVENTEKSHYPRVTVNEDVTYRSDLSAAPIRSTKQISVHPETLDLKIESGYQHIKGSEPYRGACLGGCPSTIFSLSVNSDNVGWYSITKAKFSEVTGGIEEESLSSFSDLNCVKSE